MAAASWAGAMPGAWGVAACWATAAAGVFLLSQARIYDENARRGDQWAEECFARGEEVARAPRQSKVRQGAALTLGALLAFFMSGVSMLGCFALGLVWGVLAFMPLCVLSMMACKKAIQEDGYGEN